MISGSIKEKSTAIKANVDITRNIPEKSYIAIIGKASNGDINSATPEDVANRYVELITDLSPPASKPLNIVAG